MEKLDFPITNISLDLTERCNLRCSYPCFTYGEGERDLTEEQGKKTIDWLFREEISHGQDLQLDWWGGEPFLQFELMKRLTDYAKWKALRENRKITIGGTSNVTLWTKEVVDWMAGTGSLFLMSIDGIREAHDRHRIFANGKGSFETILEKIPYIVERIPNIKMRSSLTPETIEHLADSFKFFYGLGIKDFAYSPVYEGEWTEKHLMIAEVQMKLLADFAVETKKQGKDIFIKHLDDGARVIASPGRQVEHPCGAGRAYVGIGVDGVIYPCHRFNKYGIKRAGTSLGSIDDGIINKKLRQVLIHFVEIPPPEKCETCRWFRKPCQISCYAINQDLTGNIGTPPEVYCKFQERQGRAIEFYLSRMKHNNLPIPGAAIGLGPCICNNLCYSEGTPNQIKHVDPRNAEMTCVCNNTNYTGPKPAQARPLTPQERAALLAFLPSAPGPSFSPRGEKLLTDLTATMDKLNLTMETLIKLMQQKLNP